MELKAKKHPFNLTKILTLVFSLALIIFSYTPCRSQTDEQSCADAVQTWTKTFQQLENKINELTTIQQAPIDRVVQRPLVQDASDKTIAQQISETLQVKEGLVNAKKQECREVMAQEEQVFSQVQNCLPSGKDARNRDVKKVIRHRNAVLEKAASAMADVREVEGKETNMPYTEAMQGQQDMYRGGAAAAPNSYWQSYQQMYRRWWGY